LKAILFTYLFFLFQLIYSFVVAQPFLHFSIDPKEVVRHQINKIQIEDHIYNFENQLIKSYPVAIYQYNSHGNPTEYTEYFDEKLQTYFTKKYYYLPSNNHVVERIETIYSDPYFPNENLQFSYHANGLLAHTSLFLKEEESAEIAFVLVEKFFYKDSLLSHSQIYPKDSKGYYKQLLAQFDPETKILQIDNVQDQTSQYFFEGKLIKQTSSTHVIEFSTNTSNILEKIHVRAIKKDHQSYVLDYLYDSEGKLIQINTQISENKLKYIRKVIYN